MPGVHGANDPYALPKEAERAYVGVVSRTNELGQVDVLQVMWPYPPCRTLRVLSSKELSTRDPAGAGTTARTWLIRVGRGGAQRVLFHQQGRWFVRHNATDRG